ncbi:MAG: DNA alkylation repair protein [Dehalococcoidia bacterium]
MKARDEKFIELLPVTMRKATDERNFVKKAVNWALRDIGKKPRFEPGSDKCSETNPAT